MATRISRRDVLRFAGGATVGTMLTPLPYKLLDDLAIWTQNWHLTPKLPRGPLSAHVGTCTACPAGCALRVRCTGELPVGVAPLPSRPGTRPALCAAGLGIHHLPFHPRRLDRPQRRDGEVWHPVSRDAVLAEAADALRRARARGRTVAVLDARPGRAASDHLRAFAAAAEGRYVTAPALEDAFLAELGGLTAAPPAGFGLDLERARLVVSFGDPALAGWGEPGRLAACRAAGLKVVQVDARPSPTAQAADQWIPLRPGAEGALALSLAHVLLDEGRVDGAALGAEDLEAFTRTCAAFAPERLREVTEVPAETVRELARRLVREGPALALGAGDPGGGPLEPATRHAIWTLNLLLGSLGRPGGVRARAALPGAEDVPAAARWTDLPDASVGFLVVDAAPAGDALPLEGLRRKLAADAVVLALGSHLHGLATAADWIVPAPAWAEGLDELPTPPAALRATWRLSAPRLAPPEGAGDPLAVLGALAARAGLALAPSTTEAEVNRRAAALHAAGRGSLFDPASRRLVPVADLASPAALVRRLVEGATWLDDDGPETPAASVRLLGAAEGGPDRLRSLALGGPVEGPVLLPFGTRPRVGEAPVSPLLAKLDVETELAPAPGDVLVAPATARGLRDGARARVVVEGVSIPVRVRHDRTVRPGNLHLCLGAEGEGGRAACRPDANGTWRLRSARLEEV